MITRNEVLKQKKDLILCAFIPATIIASYFFYQYVPVNYYTRIVGVKTMESSVIKTDPDYLTLYYRMGTFNFELIDEENSILSIDTSQLVLIETDIDKPRLELKYKKFLIGISNNKETLSRYDLVSSKLFVPRGKLIITNIPNGTE